MEGLIRKVVWLFRERPRTAAAVTALALTILLGGSVLLIRSRQRSEAAKLIGNRLSGMELRKALLTAYKRASARGALSPLVGQELLVLQDKGIPFLVTVMNDAVLQAKSGPSLLPTPISYRPVDAFATIPTDLFIAPIGTSHYAILNKFPVIPLHTVLVTSKFLPQEAGASTTDLDALWTFVHSFGGVGFFNCGPNSGASQPRRHMQFIPYESLRQSYPPKFRDVAPSVDIPIEVAIGDLQAQRGFIHIPGEPFTLHTLPFPHSICMLGGDVHIASAERAARRLYEYYAALLQHAFGTGVTTSPGVSVGAAESGASVPAGTPLTDAFTLGSSSGDPKVLPSHNLLLTPRWMMVVPRRQPDFDSVPINALGFAGLFLARGAQLQVLQERGPMDILKACAGLADTVPVV